MKALLTIEEAAELLKLSIKTLYTYVERESIPHIRLGRRVLFSTEKLEEWVNNCSILPGGRSLKKPRDEINPVVRVNPVEAYPVAGENAQ